MNVGGNWEKWLIAPVVGGSKLLYPSPWTWHHPQTLGRKDTSPCVTEDRSSNTHKAMQRNKVDIAYGPIMLLIPHLLTTGVSGVWRLPLSVSAARNYYKPHTTTRRKNRRKQTQIRRIDPCMILTPLPIMSLSAQLDPWKTKGLAKTKVVGVRTNFLFLPLGDSPPAPACPTARPGDMSSCCSSTSCINSAFTSSKACCDIIPPAAVAPPESVDFELLPFLPPPPPPPCWAAFLAASRSFSNSSSAYLRDAAELRTSRIRPAISARTRSHWEDHWVRVEIMPG